MKSNVKLIDDLQTVLQHLDNRYLLANPYFRLVKPVAESLKTYSAYFRFSPRFLVIAYAVRLPFTILISFLTNLFISTILPWEWAKVPRKGRGATQVVLLSQVTTRFPDFNQDPSLGSIPRILDEKFDLSVFFLNGTRTFGPLIKKELSKQTDTKVIINSKVLSPFSTLLLLIENLKAVFIFLRNLQRRKIFDQKIMPLIMKGLVLQFKRKTIANLILIINFKKATDFHDFRSLIMTIEGHAHEAMLIHYISNEVPNAKIVAVQHAPIVPSQIGYFNNLALLREEDELLCSGPLFAQLSRLAFHGSNAKPPSIRVLGSSKSVFVKDLELRKILIKKTTVLLLPEGTYENFLEFCDILHYLASKNRDKKFVLRVHPATRRPFFKGMRNNFLSMANVEISNLALSEDLERSFVCVYRSSAAAIQAMALGVIPIHYNSRPEYDLDPILQSYISHPTACNLDSLNSIVSEIERTKFFQKKYRTSLPMFSQEYFQDLNPSILDAI